MDIRMWVAIAALFLAGVIGGCSLETSQDVKIAPSAEPYAEAILEAVARLNELAGHEAYTVSFVDDGSRRDDAIVIRDGYTGSKVAYTERFRRGVVIVLSPRVNVRGVAHELGHAAGLDHHSHPRNLMYDLSTATGWALEPFQLEEIR